MQQAAIYRARHHRDVLEACLAPAPPPLALATEPQAGVLLPSFFTFLPSRSTFACHGSGEVESTLQVPSRFSFSHNAFPGIAQIYSGQQWAKAGIHELPLARDDEMEAPIKKGNRGCPFLHRRLGFRCASTQPSGRIRPRLYRPR
jgi:hypothetical protein